MVIALGDPVDRGSLFMADRYASWHSCIRSTQPLLEETCCIENLYYLAHWTIPDMGNECETS